MASAASVKEKNHDDLKRIITGLLTSLTHKCTIKQLCNDFISIVGYPIPYRSYGYHNAELYLKSIPDIVKVSGTGPHALVEGIIQAKSAHINELVTKQKNSKNVPRRLKGRIPTPRKTRVNGVTSYSNDEAYTASCTIPVTNNKHSNRNDDVVFNNPASLATELNSYKSNVPYEVQNNLRKLIKEFTNGIWCTEIPDEYRRHFRRSLCFEKYSYRSLIEMISDLPEIFHYVQPATDDYLIFDKNTPLPRIDETTTDDNSKDTNTEDGLPKIDWMSLKSLIPSDIVHLAEVIPRYFMDKNVGDYVDISIGEVYDISKFWCFLTFGPLVQLMKDLEEFFKIQRNKYQVPEHLLEEGLYIVTLFDKLFHRAVVINLLPNTPKQVKVLFIDYGTVWKVNTDEIWYLPRQFGKTPCQAMRARLSNLEPPIKHTPWQIDCINRFRELTTNRDLAAEITKINNDDKIIEIYLADITDQDNIFYINDVLVKEGYACYTGQAKTSTLKYTTTIDFIHLYPAFCEIEAGYAPNVEELNFILQNGITIDQYLPQYFSNDIKDDIEHFDKKHNEYKKNFKLPKFEKKNFVVKNFDFSLFPIDMYNDIREIYNGKIKKVNDKKQPNNNNNNINPIDQNKASGLCNRNRIINKMFNEESNTNRFGGDVLENTITSINQSFFVDTTNCSSPTSSGFNSSLNYLNHYHMMPVQINQPTMLQPTNPFLNLKLDMPNLNPNNPFLPDILQSRMIKRDYGIPPSTPPPSPYFFR